MNKTFVLIKSSKFRILICLENQKYSLLHQLKKNHFSFLFFFVFYIFSLCFSIFSLLFVFFFCFIFVFYTLVFLLLFVIFLFFFFFHSLVSLCFFSSFLFAIFSSFASFNVLFFIFEFSVVILHFAVLKRPSLFSFWLILHPFHLFHFFAIFVYFFTPPRRLIFVIKSLLCLLLLEYFLSDPYIIIPLVHLQLRQFFFVSPSFLASYSLFIFYFLKCLSFFFFSKLIIHL